MDGVGYILLGEVKREAEGGDQLRAKESCHLGDLWQLARRPIESDNLKRERSIGPGRFVSSIHGKCWLSIGARRR